MKGLKNMYFARQVLVEQEIIILRISTPSGYIAFESNDKTSHSILRF